MRNSIELSLCATKNCKFHFHLTTSCVADNNITSYKVLLWRTIHITFSQRQIINLETCDKRATVERTPHLLKPPLFHRTVNRWRKCTFRVCFGGFWNIYNRAIVKDHPISTYRLVFVSQLRESKISVFHFSDSTITYDAHVRASVWQIKENA